MKNIMIGMLVAASLHAQTVPQSWGVSDMEKVAAFYAVTNPAPGLQATNVVTPTTLLPGLSSLEQTILNHLVDDSPYVTNGKVSVDLALLYNSSNPKGTGKVGMFGAITLPTTQQSAVGIGAGVMAHHSFMTPVTFTVGTTLTNLPSVLGRWYLWAGDGVLYDFTGKQVGNWAATGAFHNWVISGNFNLGVKFGSYDDSVISGIGWFGAITGTF